jgi:hypothetical protein
LGLAAFWFGLSNAVIGDLLRVARPLDWPRDVVPLLRRLGVTGVLCLIQCATAWAIVSSLTGQSGAGMASLALLMLVAAVGLAWGCLIVVVIAPRPPLTWVTIVMTMIPLWLFGGGPQSLPKEASWVRAFSNALPSRWGFEGLLLLRHHHAPSSETARQADRDLGRDDLEVFFPANSDRMGVKADSMALVSMLIGLSSASAFLTWSSRRGRGTSPDP